MSDKFTIRGFTAEVRKRDVSACWPFPTVDATEEQMLSWLPPMTGSKFRWWADDLVTVGRNILQDTPSGNKEGEISGEMVEEEKLENPPVEVLENPLVEELVPQPEDGEKEPENSLEESLSQMEEERSENPLVEELVLSQPEEGEKEPENLLEESLSQKEEEKLENQLVEEAISQPEDGERAPEGLLSEKEKLENQLVEEVISHPEDGEREREKEKLVNPPEEEVISHPEDGEREPEKEKLVNSPVEEVISHPEDGEREPEKEKLVNSPVEEVISHPEDGEREPEKEKLVNSPVEEVISHPKDGESEREKEKLVNPPVEEVISQHEGGERESKNLTSSSKDKFEMACPVCFDFRATTLTDVKAHIEGCMKEQLQREMMSKSKSKELNNKKQHSVAEIVDVEMEEREENPQEHERSGIKTNAMKLWPFGDDISTTVQRLRWLSQRLEALALKNGADSSTISLESERMEGGTSNPSLPPPEITCPVCRVFKAATVTAVNEHTNSCLVQAMRNNNWQTKKGLCSKPPKKRSMTEILNAAPKLDGESSNVEEGVGMERKKESKGRSKMEKLRMKMKKKMKMVMMKKLMKMKNRVNNDEVASSKEEANKNMEQNSATRTMTLEGNGSEKEQSENCGPVEMQQEQQEQEQQAPVEMQQEQEVPVEIQQEQEAPVEIQQEQQEQEQEAMSPIYGIVETHKPISESISRVCNIQQQQQFTNAVGEFAAQNLMKPCSNQEKGKSSSSGKFDNGNTTLPLCPSHADASTSLSADMIGYPPMRFNNLARYLLSREQNLKRDKMATQSKVRLLGKDAPLGETSREKKGDDAHAGEESIRRSHCLQLRTSPGNVLQSTNIESRNGGPNLHLTQVPNSSPISSNTFTGKRPATDLVDLTRPSKLPYTGQSSPSDAELLGHARFLMMNAGGRKTQQNEVDPNPNLSLDLNLNPNLDLNLNPNPTSGYDHEF